MNRFLLLILVLTSLHSCHKDEVIFIPDQNYVISRETMIASLTDTARSYEITVNNSETTTLFIPDVAVFEIPSGALASENGSTVSGQVKVLFDDATGHKSDLLKAPSLLYNDDAIDVNKVFRVRFEKDNKPLVLKQQVQAYIPAKDVQGDFRLFYSPGDEVSTWQQLKSPADGYHSQKWEIIYKDGMITVTGFKITLSSQGGWYCIGNFAENGSASTTVRVSLPSGFNSSNTLVFWLPTGLNTAVRMFGEGNSSDFGISGLRSGQNSEGKIITISDFGGDKYYFGIRNAVKVSEDVVTLTPTQHKLSEIRDLLRSL